MHKLLGWACSKLSEKGNPAYLVVTFSELISFLSSEYLSQGLVLNPYLDIHFLLSGTLVSCLVGLLRAYLARDKDSGIFFPRVIFTSLFR